MNLREIWTGTTDERKVINEGNRLQRKPRLTQKDEWILAKSEKINRRLFLTRAGVITGGVVLGTVVVYGTNRLLASNSSENISRGQIITNEIAKLGIRENLQEKQLWQREGFPSLDVTAIQNMGDKEKGDASIARLEKLVSVMKKSQNPYFKDAANFLDPLILSHELVVRINIDPKTKIGYGDDLAAVSFRVEGNRIRWTIGIWADQVLGRDSLFTAILLTHEAEHLKNMVEIENKNKHLSLEDRIRLQTSRFNNTEEVLQEESKGYGVQARAIIHQAGLMGNYPKGGESEELAATYVLSHGDLNNPIWKNYIKRAVEE